MLDPTTPEGGRAHARLTDEKIAWMTTVRPNGQPQTSPVWFLYDGGEFLVYSKAGTARTANLQANPRVSINLDGNGEGGDVVVVEGTARIDPDAPPSSDVAAYQDKYGPYLERNGWTPEWFAANYPIAIRVMPVRSRVW